MNYINKSELEEKYGDRLIRLTSLSTGDITFLYNNHVDCNFKAWVQYMAYEPNLIVSMDNFGLDTLRDTLSNIKAVYYIRCNDASLGQMEAQPAPQNLDKLPSRYSIRKFLDLYGDKVDFMINRFNYNIAELRELSKNNIVYGYDPNDEKDYQVSLMSRNYKYARFTRCEIIFVMKKNTQPAAQFSDNLALLQGQIYHHLILDRSRKEYNKKIEQLLDEIGCWSIDTIQFEHEFDTIQAHTYNEIPPSMKEFQLLVDSLENNQTIYVALRDHNPHLLYTNDVLVTRDNLLPFISHLYIVQEKSNDQSSKCLECGKPTKNNITPYCSSECYMGQPKAILDATIGTDRFTEAEFQNEYAGQVGKVIIVTEKTDLKELLSDMIRDDHAGKAVWYKLSFHNEMYKLSNPSALKTTDLKIVEKVVVIPPKIDVLSPTSDITKKKEIPSESDNIGRQLWDMKLHDEMNVRMNSLDEHTGGYRYDIIRVPGGWLYVTAEKTATFVPLNNEFI